MFEPRIEPPERKDQARINYLHDLEDAEIRISAFLDEFRTLFSEEIRNFELDLRMRVSNETRQSQ